MRNAGSARIRVVLAGALPFTEANAGSSSVFGDELDARGFESAPDIRDGAVVWRPLTRFEIDHRFFRNRRCLGQAILRPLQQGSRSAALSARNHHFSVTFHFLG